MTAPVAQSQFTAYHSHSNLEVAAMWRGAAIDLFAALEEIALACFIALDAADEAKSKASDFVAWPRFERLATVLADDRFRPWNRKALQLLKRIECEHELRTALAHGRMKATGAGMTLKWKTLDNGAWQPRIKTLSWLEALGALHRLDELQQTLSSQLGQIRHRCLKNRDSAPQVLRQANGSHAASASISKPRPLR